VALYIYIYRERRSYPIISPDPNTSRVKNTTSNSDCTAKTGLTGLCLFCHLCKNRSNISYEIGPIGAIVPLGGIGGVLCAKVQYGGTKLASSFAELGMLVIGSGYVG
jgi:hypothetical protein